jgi:predicted ATP-grasp superfamily ATP-dependent carboligase
MTQTPAVPVLVLGARITALGVIRTLGRAGITNYLLSDCDVDFACWSRWRRSLSADFAARPDPGALYGWLESAPFERAVLLPCADDWVLQVANLPPHLRARFPASIAEPAAMACFVDKGKFSALLHRHSIPHPRTSPIASPEDLDRLTGNDFPGMFLKPRSSQEFFNRYGVKAFRVAERESAVKMAADAIAHGVPLMLQEYIPGPPTAHYFIDGFVDRNGAVTALFARRRIRMHPPDFGNSSLHESVPLERVEPAADALRTLLHAVNYRGIFSAEFKFDARDGLFKILEVNARPWWYIEFAAACGVDVCSMAYRDALGLRCEPVRSYQVGRRCVTFHLDLKAYLRLRRQKHLSFWSWIRSWLHADHPVFSWTDPGPSVRMLLDVLGGIFRE